MGSREQKEVNDDIRRFEDVTAPNAVSFVPPERDLSQVAPRDRDAMDEQFRSEAYQTKDARDELMTAKLQLQEEGQPGVTKFGVLQAKDEDFEWLRKKREQAEYANFSQWFAENFDKMDPAQKKLAKEMFPQFYRERLERLNKDAHLATKLAQLKLLGAHCKDDLILQYAAESGYIPADPLEHILHPERAKSIKAQSDKQARFGRGLLNPRRLVTGDYGLLGRKYNAETLTGRALPDSAWQRGAPGTGVGFSSYNGNQAVAGPINQMDFLQDLL